MSKLKTLDALVGLCVGDALGVPVEFLSRDRLKQSPVTEMAGYGTHNQPEGTWSDDSSLAFCLAESLCKGYDLQDIANNFLRWYNEEIWTPHGKVFDIGITTSRAIHKINQRFPPLLCGGTQERDNGNGSLMRILPLIFYIKDKPIEERFRLVSEVSSITHAHIRSVVACFIYCEYALLLLAGKDKMAAYQEMQTTLKDFLQNFPICDELEKQKFHHILEFTTNNYEISPLYTFLETEIESSGYVLSTLEASFWCFLRTETYAEAVLMAINLGEDTDTTGCVTGGLAGLYYGVEAIPEAWRNAIAKKKDIEILADKLALI